MEATIDNLKNGKCILINDGTKEEVNKILRIAFPGCKTIIDLPPYFLFKADKTNGTNGGWELSYINDTGLPAYSTKDFIKNMNKDKLEFMPKYGEKVLVSNDNKLFEKRIFVGESKGNPYKYITYICTDEPGLFANTVNSDNFNIIPEARYKVEFWKYIKQIEKVNVTLEEIANWKGCDSEDIVII